MEPYQETDTQPHEDPAETAKAKRVSAVTDTLSIVSTLSRQERTFVIHYLAGETRTKAAEIAGYAYPGKQGSRLANSAKIRAVIDEFFHQQEMGAREVVALLSEQARAAYAPYLQVGRDELGRQLPGVDVEALLRDGKGHLIKSIKYSQYGVNIEFHDAHAARQDIGRYHGLFGAKGTEDDPIQHAVTYITENRPKDD